MTKTNNDRNEDADAYACYQWHANTLRTWLVAYGIGAPVLFVTRDAAFARLTAAPCFPGITTIFLGGVALQVCLAFLNKTVNWTVYYGEAHADFKEKRRFKMTKWLSGCYVIDFLLDLATIILFACATVKVYCALSLSS